MTGFYLLECLEKLSLDAVDARNEIFDTALLQNRKRGDIAE